MKKLLVGLVVMAMLAGVVVPVLAQTDDASACVNGHSPGWWKNTSAHPWPAAYSPTEDYFDEVFGSGALPNPWVPLSSAYSTAPHETLLTVLQKGGGGFDALNRHLVAALLNAAWLGPVDYLSLWRVEKIAHDAYASGDWESAKDYLESTYSWAT